MEFIVVGLAALFGLLLFGLLAIGAAWAIGASWEQDDEEDAA